MPTNVPRDPAAEELSRMLALGIQAYAQKQGLVVEFIADQSEDRNESPMFNRVNGWVNNPCCITIIMPGGEMATGFVTGLCKISLAESHPGSAAKLSCVRNCSQWFEGPYNHVPAFVKGVIWQLTPHEAAEGN